MKRRKRTASGFGPDHAFWPKAIELWQRGYTNAQVARVAQSEGHNFNEDQIRYARNRHWNAVELPARGAKWLREAVREATEGLPNALDQQQHLFEANLEVHEALKERLLERLGAGPPATDLELAELKVLLDAYARQGRLLNETHDTVVVLHAKLGRLEGAGDVRESDARSPVDPEDDEEGERWVG